MPDNASCLTQLYSNYVLINFSDCKFQIMQWTSQIDNIFATLDQSKPKMHQKRYNSCPIQFLI